MISKPMVTIILTTYNRAHFIEETLLSIQNQIYNNFECLIIDDGCTDQTAEVIQPFLKNDVRFKFIKRNNAHQKGLPGCRNLGLDTAQGEFVVFCDDDDFMHSDHLKHCLEILNDKDYDFYHFQKKSFTDKIPEKICFLKNSEVTEINKDDIVEIVSEKLGLASCTMFWRQEIIKRNRFNEQLQYAEEWEFYIRLIANGARGIQDSAILYFNRKHPQSNTGEFYSGDPIRIASKVKATQMVISTLDKTKMLNHKIVKYFTWLSFQLKSKEIYNILLAASSLSRKRKFIESIRYHLAPGIEKWLKLKKQFKS